MEALARRVLDKPLEIIVGERSVICANVKLHAELLPDEDAKFIRLLEILGRWYNEESDQRMIVFVDRQEAADELLKELFRRGYRCLSLHGGKDQMDRDSTIEDFKSGVFDILIATSVASRGLDVKECNVVVNYDCPSHLEDLVHRCGRTGRGMREGEAYTFITPEEGRYSPILYKGLLSSGAVVPPELKQMVDQFMDKVQRGEAKMPSSGFGGKGLERMEKDREKVKMALKLAHGDEEDFSEEELDLLAAQQESAEMSTEETAVEGEEGAKVKDTITAFEQAQRVAAKITEMVVCYILQSTV
jgi:ATP-dependent RNA helicase DDX46/PRP5